MVPAQVQGHEGTDLLSANNGDARIEAMRRAALGEDAVNSADEDGDDEALGATDLDSEETATSDDESDEAQASASDNDDGVSQLRAQYESRQTELTRAFEVLVAQRNQIQNDYQHAERRVTSSTQETAGLRRELDAAKQQIAEITTAMQAKRDPYADSYEDSGVESPQREQELLNRISTLEAALMRVVGNEEVREQERKKQEYLAQWDAKERDWQRRGVSDVPTLQKAKVLYAHGQVEQAEELISGNILMQTLDRVKSRSDRARASGVLTDADGSGSSATPSVKSKRRVKNEVLDQSKLAGLTPDQQAEIRIRHMRSLFAASK